LGIEAHERFENSKQHKETVEIRLTTARREVGGRATVN
jgi:hypothetical protein